MNLTKPFCTFAVLLLCIPSPSIAQDRNSLRDRVVASIEKTERQWKLDKDHVLNGSTDGGIDVVYLGWVFDKSRAAALIYVYPTSDIAVKRYPTAFVGCPDCVVEEKILEIKIANLGDENYVWEDRALHLTGIVFRRGNFLVGIEASSMEAAKKLAFYVANEIKP